MVKHETATVQNPFYTIRSYLIRLENAASPRTNGDQDVDNSVLNRLVLTYGWGGCLSA